MHDPDSQLRHAEARLCDTEMHSCDPETRFHDPEMRFHDPEMPLNDPEIRLHDPEMPSHDAEKPFRRPGPQSRAAEAAFHEGNRVCILRFTALPNIALKFFAFPLSFAKAAPSVSRGKSARWCRK